MKIDENAAMVAVERACPGLEYILVLHSSETKETVLIGNIPPSAQKAVMEFLIREMDTVEHTTIQAPRIHND